MRLPLDSSYWVVPARFLAGEHPFGEDPHDAQDRFAALREASIDYFLDLTETGERPSYRQTAAPGRELCAISDCRLRSPVGRWPDAADSAAIRAALAANRNLFIHCRAGIGRTGLVVGCYLADEGLHGKAALSKLNQLWQQSARSKSWPVIPQTDEQANYIRRWAKLRRAG